MCMRAGHGTFNISSFRAEVSSDLDPASSEGLILQEDDSFININIQVSIG